VRGCRRQRAPARLGGTADVERITGGGGHLHHAAHQHGLVAHVALERAQQLALVQARELEPGHGHQEHHQVHDQQAQPDAPERASRLVADAVHRRDGVHVEDPEFRADAAHVGVDGPLGHEVVPSVGPLHELAAGEDDARALEERGEGAELGGREHHDLSPHGDLVAAQLDADVAVHQHLARGVGLAVVGAPQERLDPRHQLARRERLHHVVVAAQLETEHPINLVAPRGQKEHGLLVLLPELAAEGEAVGVGQHHVEDHQVEGALLEREARGGAVARGAHGEPLALKGHLHHLADAGLVIGHEDVRCHRAQCTRARDAL
jgi:hypothetical protein